MIRYFVDKVFCGGCCGIIILDVYCGIIYSFKFCFEDLMESVFFFNCKFIWVIICFFICDFLLFRVIVCMGGIIVIGVSVFVVIVI